MYSPEPFYEGPPLTSYKGGPGVGLVQIQALSGVAVRYIKGERDTLLCEFEDFLFSVDKHLIFVVIVAGIYFRIRKNQALNQALRDITQSECYISSEVLRFIIGVITEGTITLDSYLSLIPCPSLNHPLRDCLSAFPETMFSYVFLSHNKIF